MIRSYVRHRTFSGQHRAFFGRYKRHLYEYRKSSDQYRSSDQHLGSPANTYDHLAETGGPLDDTGGPLVGTGGLLVGTGGPLADKGDPLAGTVIRSSLYGSAPRADPPGARTQLYYGTKTFTQVSSVQPAAGKGHRRGQTRARRHSLPGPVPAQPAGPVSRPHSNTTNRRPSGRYRRPSDRFINGFMDHYESLMDL